MVLPLNALPLSRRANLQHKMADNWFGALLGSSPDVKIAIATFL